MTDIEEVLYSVPSLSAENDGGFGEPKPRPGSLLFETGLEPNPIKPGLQLWTIL